MEESSTRIDKLPILLRHGRKASVVKKRLLYPGGESDACPGDVQQGGAACSVPSSPCHAEVQGRLIRTLAYALEREVLSNESTDRF
jgi:hypothetical protein